MATEIERKFLVAGESWREDTMSEAHLVQAYLFSEPDRSMRVRIENDNRATLLTLDSNADWLTTVWSLFSQQSDDKFFHSVEPDSLAIQLAMRWIQGEPYKALFAHSDAEEGSKPWGTEKRRRLAHDDIVDFCESALGFECSLVLSAVAQFLFGVTDTSDADSAALTLFQKSFKYGLPDWLSISCYETGFADRVLAQRLAEAVREDAFVGKFFSLALTQHQNVVKGVLADYPTYFETVID